MMWFQVAKGCVVVGRGERDVDEVIAAVDVGHTMAGMPLTDLEREFIRRQASGELTGDEAVAMGVARIRAKYRDR